MKKITLFLSVLVFAGLMAQTMNTRAQGKDNIFSDLTTIIDLTSATGNLPAIIDNAGATRGAGFNGQYVFVASRQNGNHVYYWDVNNPQAAPQGLNMTGVGGGTFAVSDLTALGNHIFVSNMDFAGGNFKLYHWAGIDAQPTVLINMTNTPVRLGDAITVLGNPDNWAAIVVSGHGSKSFYVWYMENGQLESTTPEVFTFAEIPANVDFARITLPHPEDEYAIISGPLGLYVLDDENDIVLNIEQSFFPGWPMYVNVFEYNGGRYLAYMHVVFSTANPPVHANKMYVLDISDGDNTLEALQSLAAATFAERVMHSVDLGSIPNGNASVSMDVLIDPFGNLWLMGFAAGNGFVLQKLGDEFGFTLPFAETFDGEGDDTEDTWLPTGWISYTLDEDEDFNWYWSPGPSANPNGQMRSQSAYSVDGEYFALTPDNWLITPKIFLDEISENQIIELSFKVGTGANTPAYKLENYSVLISTTDTDPDSFTTLWTETLPSNTPANELQPRMLDLSGYAGEVVHIAFRHHDCTDMDRLLLDDVMVQVVTSQEPEFADLTLNVRMKVWADRGVFDPAEDFVDVAGTFNEWGEEALVLTALNDDLLTYTITIDDLEVGETFLFKFRINGSWSDETSEFPSGGPNRSVTIVSGVNEYTFWYNDEDPTSVNDLKQVQFVLFPNPASNQVTLQADSRITQVMISDLTGRTLQNLPANSQEININTSALNNGIYLLRIFTEQGVSTQKLQIRK